MKGLMLRWFYSLKRPLFIVLFVSMIVCLFFSAFTPLLLGEGEELPRVFDVRMWLSAMYIGVILSIIPLMPIMSDYISPCFGKYIAVMPVSPRKYISALFCYFGLFTLVCSMICTVLPLCSMIACNTFEWRFLMLGFSIVFCADLLVVLLMIMLEVAVSRKLTRILLGFGIGSCMGAVFFLIAGEEEHQWILKLNEFLVSGNYGVMSLVLFAVTAVLAAVLWVLSCYFYRRREF